MSVRPRRYWGRSRTWWILRVSVITWNRHPPGMNYNSVFLVCARENARLPNRESGVGRPKLYEGDRVTTAVRITPELHDQFRELADKRDVSVNYLITKAMQRYLEDQTPERQSA